MTKQAESQDVTQLYKTSGLDSTKQPVSYKDILGKTEEFSRRLYIWHIELLSLYQM